MTKSDLKLLEKVWLAEIEDRLPFQSKAKGYEKLEREGMVQHYDREFGADRFGPIITSGWALTHAGRFAYCASCEEES